MIPETGPFALLHRPGSGLDGDVEVLAGPVRRVDLLDGLGLDQAVAAGPDGHRSLVLMPYRQIVERGFDCPDDGEPLLVMDVLAQHRTPLADLVAELPTDVPEVEDLAFDVDDDAYGDAVDHVVRTEIEAGEGSNFVLARSLRGRFRDFDRSAALAVFRGLLTGESGAYWTFLVHTGDRYLVGSTPERHVRVHGDELGMNPISGTYRFPGHGSATRGLLRFLHDPKEVDELYMVVDEELKMMAALCDRDVLVSGPSLTWMSHVAHTGYHLSGRSDHPLAEVLRRTMFAPTVVGSPLENACRAVALHEPGGRGYYSGVLALVGRERGRRSLDSAILIRMADIGADGAVRVTTGSTIVRDSVPAAEAAETSAKAAGLLTAMTGGRTSTVDAPPQRAHEAVAEVLGARNDGVSGFWRSVAEQRVEDLRLRGVRVAVVDAEDDFASMLAYQLRSLGCAVRIVPWHRAATGIGDHDVLLLGPGPGAPDEHGNPKIAALRGIAEEALRSGRPLTAVCLGHQVVCDLLGMPIVRLPRPNQGRRIRVRLHDRERWAGFYNSFTALVGRGTPVLPGSGLPVRVDRDPDGAVLALRGPGLATAQFHAESFLTEDGPAVLRSVVLDALAPHPFDVRGEHVHEHAQSHRSPGGSPGPAPVPGELPHRRHRDHLQAR
ncbi:anthranilate synthase family protein [Umezawaea endophytica]|uniref:anthranilate synthase n=1 Tax=Umezawaea endophytica TaxID=1654476 RepID=A0A9X2VIK1_9PSEU|nr:anthranilate synthase family protein [Umezawaea endophytica]MCS7476737.1 anthranilate synthase family protein [Umezawaea endophytica]